MDILINRKLSFRSLWLLYQNCSLNSEARNSPGFQFLSKKQLKKYSHTSGITFGIFVSQKQDVGIIIYTENPSNVPFYNPEYFHNFERTIFIPRGGIVLYEQFYQYLIPALSDFFRNKNLVINYSKLKPGIYSVFKDCKKKELDEMCAFGFQREDCDFNYAVPDGMYIYKPKVLLGKKKEDAWNLIISGFSAGSNLSPCPRTFTKKEFNLVALLPFFHKVLIYEREKLVGFIIGSEARYVSNIINYRYIKKNYQEYKKFFFIYDIVVKKEYQGFGKEVFRILSCELLKGWEKTLFGFDFSVRTNKFLDLMVRKSLRIKNELMFIDSQKYEMIEY